MLASLTREHRTLRIILKTAMSVLVKKAVAFPNVKRTFFLRQSCRPSRFFQVIELGILAVSVLRVLRQGGELYCASPST